MRLLVTGGTGFIGSAVRDMAVERGHAVALLTRPDCRRSPPLHDRLVAIAGDLAAPDWDAIERFAPDVCVHAAWITTPGVYMESPENPEYLTQSQEFLSRIIGMKPRQIVALGSCAEYVTDSGRQPASEYARCKMKLRQWLADRLTGDSQTHFVWARIFYPYGPGEPEKKLCSSLIRAVQHREPVVLNNPDSVKDYIYVADLAAAILTLVEKNCSGDMDLGTGRGITIAEIADTVARLLGGPRIKYSRPTTINRADVADIRHLHELGWRPKVSVVDGIRRLIASLEE